MTRPLSFALLSVAAKQAGSLAARALVRRMSKSSTTPGEVLQIARRLHEEANEIVVRAVVYERARGTSWELIGKALGITRQSAFKQYQGAERALHQLTKDPIEDIEDLTNRIGRLREELIS